MIVCIVPLVRNKHMELHLVRVSRGLQLEASSGLVWHVKTVVVIFTVFSYLLTYQCVKLICKSPMIGLVKVVLWS
jgi:hypothetical protein